MIELIDITKKYNQVEVLRGINLTVNSGEVYGLVGKNGAGKTTLLNILAGIVEPSSGMCLVDKERVTQGFLEKKKIGYLPDLPDFYDYLTGREYLDFLSSASPNDKSREIADYAGKIELDLSKKIKTLSRGNKQKLGILAAVLSNPDILLLDEPTSALDPVGRKDTLEMIDHLKESGITIVLSTHILSDLELVCDRIGFLHNGTIARELDLKNDQAENAFFEITVNGDDCTDLRKSISERFPSFFVSSDKNKILINERAGDGKLTWHMLLNNLEEAPIERIKGIERKERHDLEHILKEVLQS